MASSVTIKCDKCCGATCQTCGFESEALACTNQPDKVAISHPFQKDDICNGRTVRQDLDCYECVKCNRDNYEWSPADSDICEGVSFVQERGGDYPECKMVKDSVGTKADCQATCEDCNLYSENGFCSSISDYVAIDKLIQAGSFCNTLEVKQDLNCYECVKCNRDNYEWSPADSDICEGVSFVQERGGDYPECKMVQDSVGTKICGGATCEDCGYSTNQPSSTCGIPFGTAIRSVYIPKDKVCNGKTVEVYNLDCWGCVECNYANYTWEPDVSTVCEGVVFGQFIHGDYDECLLSQEAVGTKMDCGATCEDCGLDSDPGFCNGMAGYYARYYPIPPGDFCNGIEVKEYLDCYECIKCNHQDYPWEPDPSTVCEGVEFTQTKEGDLPGCTITRQEFGTSTDPHCDYNLE